MVDSWDVFSLDVMGTGERRSSEATGRPNVCWILYLLLPEVPKVRHLHAAAQRSLTPRYGVEWMSRSILVEWFWKMALLCKRITGIINKDTMQRSLWEKLAKLRTTLCRFFVPRVTKCMSFLSITWPFNRRCRPYSFFSFFISTLHISF